jgi:hypothetical protein
MLRDELALKLQFFQTKYKMTTILSTVWIVSVLSAIPQATSSQQKAI